jgi:phospholipid-transporting ATPase
MAASRPSGLPKNWPKSTEQELQERPTRHIKLNKEQEFSYCNNVVKTSKYEPYNFLPKFLMEEFNPKVKVANCYFLMISALQCIPIISNTSGYPTTMIPLSVVVLINAVFQIREDLSRHKADREANSSKALRYNRASGSFEKVLWSELAVGDAVKIFSRELIPADILILAVSEKDHSRPTGLCYVETKSLDGETNLKIRSAVPVTMATVRHRIN